MPPPSATPASGKPAGAGLTGPSPDKMTFSAKKRFFEKEIEESVQPTAKTGELLTFSLLGNITNGCLFSYYCREAIQFFE